MSDYIVRLMDGSTRGYDAETIYEEDGGLFVVGKGGSFRDSLPPGAWLYFLRYADSKYSLPSYARISSPDEADWSDASEG